ncbi:hypothetical protein VPH35_089978 [Triticum aestivum]
MVSSSPEKGNQSYLSNWSKEIRKLIWCAHAMESLILLPWIKQTKLSQIGATKLGNRSVLGFNPRFADVHSLGTSWRSRRGRTKPMPPSYKLTAA